ncbi:DUF58 domain-containing protein [Anthocerotibacter panamensis]|uniref:DUF58 domain-containing protein n=1 Tax=Anthocerotibacter panamensis TaxID=2857077 RepID=UPI001C407B89|nr:DUF58 domain-containing protein [Anthocerotibacter panamensis]
MWLESRLVRPTFGAIVLWAMVIFFFGAATNTLSGWLYAMSGLGLAFLILGALGPLWELRRLEVVRLEYAPTGVGESVTLVFTVTGHRTRVLLELRDDLPERLGESIFQAVETLPATLTYTLEPQHRGVYAWAGVIALSAAPLGLFFRRRKLPAPARLLVYPRIWLVQGCPLLEQAGRSRNQPRQSVRGLRNATMEGSTRSVRPYRSGDPMRWVHWRTSARSGTLQVRELEQPQGGGGLTLVLDLAAPWAQEHFELAIEAVASLLVLGLRRGLEIGLATGDKVITQREEGLAYLAEVALQTDWATPAIIDGTVFWFSPKAPESSESEVEWVWFGVEVAQAQVCLRMEEALGGQLERVR